MSDARIAWEDSHGRLWQGDVRACLAAMEPESVQCVATSPPFWGLRAYNTVPQIWGGTDPDCDHMLIETPGRPPMTGGSGPASAKQVSNAGSQFGNAWAATQPPGWVNKNGQGAHTLETHGKFGEARPGLDMLHASTTSRPGGATCTRCGAWRGELGSEPTVEQYIANLVEVFAAVRRVLRDDGTLWINLGSSMAGSGKGPTGHNGIGNAETRQGFHSPGAARLTGWKAKDLIQTPFLLFEALRQDGWWLRSVAPWIKRCLSGGTRVYARTAKGDMPITIRELSRLRPDTVQLWNGQRWTQLRRVWQTAPISQPLEIVLRSGETIGCTAEHRWPTRRGLLHTADLRVGDVLESTPLPEPDAPRRPAALDDQDIGWLVGTYLADGCRTGEWGLNFASHVRETERFARLERLADAYDGRFTLTGQTGNGVHAVVQSRVLRSTVDVYVGGYTARLKHLSNACWARSNAFLSAVLDGYLAGDGAWDAPNRRWRVGFTDNDALAADLRTLCARLGYSLRLHRATHQLGEQRLPGWRGQIRLEQVDRSVNSGNFQHQQDTEIVAIRESRGRTFWDLEVADEPHLFALASGVLTHNSGMPESCTDRPTHSLEWIGLFSKSATYFYDPEAGRCGVSGNAHPSGAAGWLQSPKTVETRAEGRNNHSFKATLTTLPTSRNRRNTDAYFDGLDAEIAAAEAELRYLRDLRANGGVRLGDDGLPLAFDVNPQGFEGAHFATWPPNLVKPMIALSTSERGACAACGAPWRRVVERGAVVAQQARGTHAYTLAKTDPNGEARMSNMARDGVMPGRAYEQQTVGWAPTCTCTCDCPETRPCVVLDPFAGSSTTLLVARQLGRIGWGIELQPDYVVMSLKRLRQHVLF